MKCPFCGNLGTSSVLETTTDSSGNVRRRRVCSNCNNRYSTYERSVLATPALIKSSGRRQEFDRDKLLRSLKIACVKRPVSIESLDHLVDHVEDTLRQMGQTEVESKVVGDLVMEGLRELDAIAYIRFAIVYLQLDNLEAIHAEIDKLMDEQG